MASSTIFWVFGMTRLGIESGSLGPLANTLLIWPLDRTLSGTIIPGQNGHGSDGNKRVLHIPHCSSISGASPSDCLVSYLGLLLGESYLFAIASRSTQAWSGSIWKSPIYGWLIVWVLWHINLCGLFNAESIFMQIVLFQTIQFSMRTQFNCQKHFYFKLLSLFKQFYFKQFSIA